MPHVVHLGGEVAELQDWQRPMALTPPDALIYRPLEIPISVDDLLRKVASSRGITTQTLMRDILQEWADAYPYPR